jgi:hypothetical protein
MIRDYGQQVYQSSQTPYVFQTAAREAEPCRAGRAFARKNPRCRLATFERDVEYMRRRLHAPIVWDREHNGYC